MLEYLTGLISRFFSSRTGGTWPPAPPEDPDAGVRAPRRHGRPGGSSAIALAEPDDSRTTEVDGRQHDQSSSFMKVDPGTGLKR